MNKITKALGGAVIAASLVAAPFVGVTAASAHTPEVSATCDSLIITAEYYETKPGTDAVYENVVVKEAVPYQPAVYGEPPLITPAVEYQPAVYETEYEFRHKWFAWKTTWKSDPNWNAEENDHSLGWYATGNTRQGPLVSPEVPAKDAVYGPAPLISAEVPAQEAVYEWTEVTPATPADNTPNTVEVIVDGVSLGVTEFGVSGEWYVPLAGTGHTYEVRFVAWNDPDGTKGWTKAIMGSVDACPLPEMPDTVVTYSEWTDWTADCESGTATRTRTISEQGWEWDQGTKQWVPAEPLVVTETDSRPVTFDECPIPQPEDDVVVTDWSEPVVNCDTQVGDELTVTREVTTTPYRFDEEQWAWVLDTENAETVTESDVIVVEDGMLDGLECPVTPEPTPTPSTTPVKAEPAALAETGGGDVNLLLPIAAGIASVLGGALVVAARRRSA
jgi:hypothetical protein